MKTRFEDVVLRVAGEELRDWQEVNIAFGATQAAGTFGLVATMPAYTEAGRPNVNPAARLLRTGPKVEISGDAGLIITGKVDNYDSDTDGARRRVSVSGRSPVRDIIDCPPSRHPTGRLANPTIRTLAEELADGFNLRFAADVALDPLGVIQITPGAPAFDEIARAASRTGVLCLSDPDGTMRFTRAGRQRHDGTLEEGAQPVTRFRVAWSPHKRRSDVIARGQRVSGTGAQRLRQEVTEFDAEVGEFRPVIIFPEHDQDLSDLRRQARTERSRRAASGISVTVTLSTWRDKKNTYWRPGHLVELKFPSEDIDGDFAIERVQFQQNQNEGTVAILTCVDPRALGGKKPRGRTNRRYGVEEQG